MIINENVKLLLLGRYLKIKYLEYKDKYLYFLKICLKLYNI